MCWKYIGIYMEKIEKNLIFTFNLRFTFWTDEEKMVLFYNKGEPDQVYQWIHKVSQKWHTLTQCMFENTLEILIQEKKMITTHHTAFWIQLFFWNIFFECTGGDISNAKQISKLDTHHLPKPVLLLFFFSGNIFVFQIHFLTPQLFTRSLLDNAPNYVVTWVRYPKEIYRWCNLLGWTRS